MTLTIVKLRNEKGLYLYAVNGPSINGLSPTGWDSQKQESAAYQWLLFGTPEEGPVRLLNLGKTGYLVYSSDPGMGLLVSQNVARTDAPLFTFGPIPVNGFYPVQVNGVDMGAWSIELSQ